MLFSDLFYWFCHSKFSYLFLFMVFSVLEFGVSIKTHLGRESKLYRIENSDFDEMCGRQHARVVSALSVGGIGKHVTRADDHRDIARRQNDKMADTVDMIALGEHLEVLLCSKQIGIEEHQNKENENPSAHVKVGVNCDFSVITLRNEERKGTKLGSRAEVPDCACSTVLRDTVNCSRSTNFSQHTRIRMGTKSFSNVYKEDPSPYQQPRTTAPVIVSDASKWSCLQDAYVLSKCNFVSTVNLT
jgi:hypothetical protein